jgi:hypothetical protein
MSPKYLVVLRTSIIVLKFNGKNLIIKSVFVTCNNLTFIPYIFVPLILEFRTEITKFE